MTSDWIKIFYKLPLAHLKWEYVTALRGPDDYESLVSLKELFTCPLRGNMDGESLDIFDAEKAWKNVSDLEIQTKISEASAHYLNHLERAYELFEEGLKVAGAINKIRNILSYESPDIQIPDEIQDLRNAMQNFIKAVEEKTYHIIS